MVWGKSHVSSFPTPVWLPMILGPVIVGKGIFHQQTETVPHVAWAVSRFFVPFCWHPYLSHLQSLTWLFPLLRWPEAPYQDAHKETFLIFNTKSSPKPPLYHHQEPAISDDRTEYFVSGQGTEYRNMSFILPGPCYPKNPLLLMFYWSYIVCKVQVNSQQAKLKCSKDLLSFWNLTAERKGPSRHSSKQI